MCVDDNNSIVADTCTNKYVMCIDGEYSNPMPVAGTSDDSMVTQ